MDYSKHVSTRATSQRERTPGRTDEVENSAGGYTFAVNDWVRLDRFLILGSEGGTYYIDEHTLTRENAEAVIRLAQNHGEAVVERIVEISDAGRAHKNDPALFALAIVAKLGDEAARKAAFAALPKVARIGTHLFHFAQYIEAFGGWGRGTRRAFANWYNSMDADRLASQLLKYQQRDGWSHRDLLRLAHPITASEAHRTMYDVTAHPEKFTAASLKTLPRLYTGYFATRNNGALERAGGRIALVEQFNLSWEMLPTEWRNDVKVNRKLLERMPLMATIRQLGRLTANETIKPMSAEAKLVADRLTNDEQIKRSRIHPMHYLLAASNYTAGHGFRGSLSWRAIPQIVTALNDGFRKSFKYVEPAGKNFLIGVDVSGSMSQYIGGTNLSCAEGAAALAVVIAATEPNYYVHGFTCGATARFGYRRLTTMDGFIDLGITAYDSIAEATSKARRHNFGGTDCALPMRYALEKGLDVDCFIVLTDSETWAGDIKPDQALREYRSKVNPRAKLVVVGMAANHFSIADPNDAGMMDVVGFDANVPAIITDFAR